MARRWKLPGNYREEVQRSLELLDQVLSEFDEVETDNPEEPEEDEVLEAVPVTDQELSKVGHVQVQDVLKKGPPPWPDPLVDAASSNKKEAAGGMANGSCSSPDSLAASDGPDGGRASVSSGQHVVLLPRLPPLAGGEEDQSEDDGYISMNGGRSLPRSLEGVLSLPVVDDADDAQVPSPRLPPPPSPAEAERLIASLLPRVSPRHCERRTGSPEQPDNEPEPSTPTSFEVTTSLVRSISDSERASQGTQTTNSTQSWWIPYDPLPSPSTPMTPDSSCTSPGCTCRGSGTRKFFLPLDPDFPPETGWPPFQEEEDDELDESESRPPTSGSLSFQPVIHDRLGSNHTMYLPGPPSPVPDYSPLVSDAEAVATSSEKVMKREGCSNASLSEEDSLQDQRVVEVGSVYSEDSLESEPSSLHCTWGSLAGSVDAKLEDQSPPTFPAISSEESSTVSVEKTSLWISSEDINTAGAGDTKARWSWNSSATVPEEEEDEKSEKKEVLVEEVITPPQAEKPQPDKVTQADMPVEAPCIRPSQPKSTTAPAPEKARASTDFTCIHQMLQEGLVEGLDDAPPQFKPPPPPRRLKPSLEEGFTPSPRRSSGLVYPEPSLPRRESAFPHNGKVQQPRIGIRMGVRAAMGGGGPDPMPMLLMDSPQRGAFPVLRKPHHRFSTEALDKLGLGMNQGLNGPDPMMSQDFPQKPATLPPGLTPNFHHRSSARETLRRVTSLLIRRGSSKDNKKDNSSSLKSGDGTGTNSRPKRSFFKSLWRRSRQYSLEQH